MATAGTVVARGAGNTAQASSRRGWLESLRDEATSFLKGDNNSPWAILAETVIGCVPVVGQLIDARDIIRGLVEVASAPASPLAWFNLITALIGLVPGGGDAVKRSLRAVKSRTVRIDELLDMIRRLYRGNPEQLLREALDLSRLRRILDDILTNPNLTRHLNAETRTSINRIRQNLGAQFDAFKREVDDWLSRGRRTSADNAVPHRPANGAPPTTPGSTQGAGRANARDPGSTASSNTPNASTQRTARFRSLTARVLGVMGEHMADYHCQEVKRWGTPARHDQGTANPAKLNDNHRMVQLWPVLPRGRGIDAVWRSGGARPYAVIEAKASYDPTKSLRALLGEAGDKTERSGSNTSSSNGRSGGAGRRGGGRGGGGSGAPRQSNGMVTQMSKSWIELRLMRAVGSTSLDAAIKNQGYSRHVLFFSIPQAVAHAEALVLHPSGRQVQPESHASHSVTREWTDNQISQVVNDRAGRSDPTQRRRA